MDRRDGGGEKLTGRLGVEEFWQSLKRNKTPYLRLTSIKKMSYYTAEGQRRSIRQLGAYRSHLMGLFLEYGRQESFSGTYRAMLRLVDWMATAHGTEEFFATTPVLQATMRAKCKDFLESPICGERLRGLTEAALRRLG